MWKIKINIFAYAHTVDIEQAIVSTTMVAISDMAALGNTSAAMSTVQTTASQTLSFMVVTVLMFTTFLFV